MSFDLSQAEVGIRILDDDVTLIEKKPHPTESRAWDGVVEVEGEDLERRFGISRIALGTKSCLAQLGIFVSIRQKEKTKKPEVEIEKKDDREILRAKIKASNYSSYPVAVEVSDPIGRFFNKFGAPLNKPQVEQLMSQRRDAGTPIYAGDSEVEEEGEIILETTERIFKLNPETEMTPPYRVTTRKDLPALQIASGIDGTHAIEQGDFVVTDTPELFIPPGFAGLLYVDQTGDMAMPAHLNSPLVDPKFKGPLKLELYQPHPYPVLLKDVYVRMYLFRAEVLDAIIDK